MCLKIFICKGFITFFPFWMPSFVTAKASTFPALYQAMPVHKQQHLTVQRAFFYPLDCSHDVRGVPTTDWKPSTQEIIRDHRAAWLTQGLFVSVETFWDLSAKEPICSFGVDVTFLTRRKKIFCGTKAHLNLFHQYKWKIIYSLKFLPNHQAL